jgi:hypothetical protein
MKSQSNRDGAFILCDDDWLGFVLQHRGEIVQEIQAAYPGAYGLEVGAGAVRPTASATGSADEFAACLDQMAAGLQMIEDAEAEYARQVKICLLQSEPKSSRLSRFVISLFTPGGREAFNGDMELRRSPPVTFRTAGTQFIAARNAATDLAFHGGQHAAAWVAQAWAAAVALGREPASAVKEAAAAFTRATISSHLTARRKVVVRAAGQNLTVDVGGTPRNKATRPVLAWPGSLGCELPRQIDDPIATAANIGAADIEIDGNTCIMEIAGWRVRLPLSPVGAEIGPKYLKILGKADTMLLQHAGVPACVDYLKLLRETLPGQRFMLTVKFHYPVPTAAKKLVKSPEG